MLPENYHDPDHSEPNPVPTSISVMRPWPSRDDPEYIIENILEALGEVRRMVRTLLKEVRLRSEFKQQVRKAGEPGKKKKGKKAKK